MKDDPRNAGATCDCKKRAPRGAPVVWPAVSAGSLFLVVAYLAPDATG